MNPAFSVILFTTLSGTGLGLWFWLGLRIAFGDRPEWFDSRDWVVGVSIAAALVAAGVIASLWHLGKPLRVWRAFSQWRSSWMSREGLLVLACFAPASAIVWLALVFVELPVFQSTGLFDGLPPEEPAPPSMETMWALRIAAASLLPLSFIAVFSTAMIYATLKPIPAWRHPLVVPAYLLFAALGGGLLFGAIASNTLDTPGIVSAGIVVGAIVLCLVKQRYWNAIDHEPLPLGTDDAVGLPGRAVSNFERPHTESNYLSREMGFVVARKHAIKLRAISVILFAAIPAACALLALLFSAGNDSAVWLWAGAVSFQLGAIFERWLFFAEAKHLVTLYY